MIHVNNKKKIGIICAVYNSEEYLEECILSILKQEYKNFLVVFVDDCSTDNSSQIIKNFQVNDKRIICIKNDKNGGCAFSKNVGLKFFLSRNDVDFVTFVDSDDSISKDYLSGLVNAQIASNCNIVVSKYTRNEDDFSTTSDIDIIRGIDFYLNKSKYNYPSNCCQSKLFKLNLFENNLLPSEKIHEDIYVIPKLIMSSLSICLLNDVNYFYRINPDSIVNQKVTKRKIDRIIGLEMMADFAIDNNYNCQNHFIGCAINGCNDFICKVKQDKRYEQKDKKDLIKFFKFHKKRLKKKFNPNWTISKPDKFLCYCRKKEGFNYFIYKIYYYFWILFTGKIFKKCI